MQQLRALGARDVVVSAGPDGLTWYAADGTAVRARLGVSLDGNPTGAGDAVFTPGLAGLVLGEFREMSSRARTEPEPASAEPSSPVPELTERETEILRYVAMGMTAKEIAADLVISHRTVQNHVQNILGKLHLHNRVELTRFAISRGLDKPE